MFPDMRILVVLLSLAWPTLAVAAQPPDPERAARESAMIRAVRDVAEADWRLGRIAAGLRLVETMTAVVSRDHATAADLVVLTLERGRLLSAQASQTGTSHDEAIEVLRRALEEARDTGDVELLAEAQDHLGLGLYMRSIGTSTHEEAAALFTQALATRREREAARGVAETLFHLGLTRENRVSPTAEDLAAAKRYHEEALRVAEAGGFDLEASYAYRHLAGHRDDAGDLDGARAYFEKSLELRQKVRAVLLLPPAHIALADVLVKRGESERAAEHYERAATLAAEIGAVRHNEIAKAGLARLRTERTR